MTEYDETSDAESPSGSALLKMGTWLRRGTTSPDTRQLFLEGGRDADVFYRKCWSHDKVVRSTHGVNCTGSCSWKIYVKEGIITWESQQTDYPSTGPDMPDYEPRGCPRGASFSWYEYSPTRIRHPYVRSVLLDAWRDKLAEFGDPVDAWASITNRRCRPVIDVSRCLVLDLHRLLHCVLDHLLDPLCPPRCSMPWLTSDPSFDTLHLVRFLQRRPDDGVRRNI